MISANLVNRQEKGVVVLTDLPVNGEQVSIGKVTKYGKNVMDKHSLALVGTRVSLDTLRDPGPSSPGAVPRAR